MKKITVCIAIITIFSFFVLYAQQVEFEYLNITKGASVLFHATANAPGLINEGTPVYKTSFATRIGSAQSYIQQLTFFPERMFYLPVVNELMIYNRYGLFQSINSYKTLTPLANFPSFVNGNDIQIGKISPLAVSPNGRYVVYMRETNAVYGELVFIDLFDNYEIVISRDIAINLSKAPFLWAPESNYVIYEKDRNLYYYSIKQQLSGIGLEERLRVIGPGVMDNVTWTRDNALYYLIGTRLLRIIPEQLPARTLYQDYLTVGESVTTIPFAFDASLDKFWINPEGTAIMIAQAQKNIFLYSLPRIDSVVYPGLYLTSAQRVIDVHWNYQNIITLEIAEYTNYGRVLSLKRILIGPEEKTPQYYDLFITPGAYKIQMSPAESQMAVFYTDRIMFYDYSAWELNATLMHEHPLQALFLDERTVIVGGKYYTERYDMTMEQTEFLFYSQIDELGFDGSIIAMKNSSNSKYTMAQFIPTLSQWKLTDMVVFALKRDSNNYYRISSEQLYDNAYKNMLIAWQGQRQIPLFNKSSFIYDYFPGDAQKIDTQVFSHGSRTDQRTVTLTFNAIDSSEGLYTILNTLQQYGASALFFLNGQYMKEFPDDVRILANSTHEVGSLFNVYFNMSNPRYTINTAFLSDGLIQNEQKYYELTGQVLDKYWHTPYYYVDEYILKALSQLGDYRFVNRDIDSLDWVAKHQNFRQSRLYYNSEDLLTNIIRTVLPGSIIAMSVGKPYSEQRDAFRDTYLFNKLDVLLNYLWRKGYTISTITNLIGDTN